MLTLNDLYALQAPAVALTDFTLRGSWFPEINTSIFEDEATLAVLQEEGRFQLRELLNPYIDGYRVAQMYTLWFDGKPVATMQNAGRAGQDESTRWVTDKDLYLQLLTYLLTHSMKLQVEDITDLADPAEPRYEEDLLYFNGTDHSSALGFTPQPVQPGVLLLRSEYSGVEGLDSDEFVVLAKANTPTLPEFIRRQGYVMRKLAESTVDSCNQNLKSLCLQDGYDRVYVYKHAKIRPADAVTVLPI